MGIKYFCDKCGKEIKKSDFITIKIDMGIHKIEEKFCHLMDDKKNFYVWRMSKRIYSKI